MKKLKHLTLILTLLLGLSFYGCQKVIDFPLRDSETRLVIEGTINNLDSIQYVRISKTKSYLTPNTFDGVTDAFVEITEVLQDGRTLIDTLSLTDIDGECKGCIGGYYQSRKLKQATPGATYKLRVIHQGKTHFATTRLQEIVPIDTLTYKYQKANPPFRDSTGYYVTLKGKEPDTSGNNYRIKVYRNRFPQGGEGVPDYLVNDDRAFNGVYIINELPYVFKENDTARVELISIEPIMYRYYQTLIRQVFAGGNPFAPPGDNLVTNIKGDPAFGFFGSFAISRREVIIKKP